MVPKIASPCSAASRTPSTFSKIHCNFPPEKYVAGGRPARCLITSPRPSRSRAAAILSVRVSCQTMAFPYGSPVIGFQTTVVSRWLVIPRPARSAAVRLGPRGLLDDLLGTLPDLEGIMLHPSRPAA